MGRVFGTSEEIEENAEKKNKFDFVKNFIDKISKSKKQEDELTCYQLQLLEELGLKEAAEE